MPPKAKVPAPIDRPLSKAYLREFSGWSTEFPPGLSEPTSLRIMENVALNRDGSAVVRPGLRYLSYATVPDEDTVGVALAEQCVGTHEAFFLDDGTKAYLFAVREDDGTVGFRVLALESAGATVRSLTAAGFSVPQTEAVLNFSSATTYVKYLQIDNKIFALSNAGETMRLFYVGENKLARALFSIEKPEWTVDEKLAVVEPDAAWITSGVPTGSRVNLIPNPSFETGVANWTPGSDTGIAQSNATAPQSGTYVGALTSLPERTNLVKQPLHDVATTGVAPWVPSTNTVSALANASYLKFTSNNTSLDRLYYGYLPTALSVKAGQSYTIAYDLGANANNDYGGMSVYWYNAAGTKIGQNYLGMAGTTAVQMTAGRKVVGPVTAPAGATVARLLPTFAAKGSTTANFNIKNVMMVKTGESTAMFNGGSGVDYHWTGAVNASESVYHPDKTVLLQTAMLTIEPNKDYNFSAYIKHGGTARQVVLRLFWYDGSGAFLSSTVLVGANDAVGYTRYNKTGTSPALAAKCIVQVQIDPVSFGEVHYVDALQLEQATVVGAYFDGDNADSTSVQYTWASTVGGSASTETTYSTANTIPPSETPTVNTLIHSTPANNTYSFGYFYTFSNEVGESAASQVKVIRAQRPWSGWKWEAASATGEPNGTTVSDPALAADQLVAYMTQDVYDAAKAQGATSWNLYMLTWSNQDSVPVEGVLIGTKQITAGGAYGTEGWIRHTPQAGGLGLSAALPSATNRRNYSTPSSAGQGIVAADRIVLVDDPVEPAVIRWSSNQQGDYTNFTAAKGGGYKTLTSGNLYVPAAVKLWQNPQSVDTLTILCSGVDGMSTGYYMAPSSISQQSETVTVMGFEETTATPGTVSPYGCEVLNNALYHPLDEQLMKSTATNYNINHKSQTEQIQRNWSRLLNKHRIISSQHDNRLYFIVHNPEGAALEDGCMGNELWVLDVGTTTPTWARWLIQACSLRKIESGGQVYMSVVRPDGIFYLDPYYDRDDYVDSEFLEVMTRFIPWRLETNTQGANRSHDAWCHLQQVSMSLGNFQGRIRWGIRSRDVNGRAVQVAKTTWDPNAPSDDGLPFDLTDHLAVRRDLMEWFLFAGSETDPDTGEVLQSFGQIDFVQYRYTPVSVNVGYEYGEVETFEYTRSQVQLSDRNTDNGVPQPFVDTTRP